MEEYMLTTPDNPYNPFDDFDNWYYYDVHVLKYNTTSILASFALTSNGLSPQDNEREIDEAMNKLVSMSHLLFPERIYIKIKKDEDLDKLRKALGF